MNRILLSILLLITVVSVAFSQDDQTILTIGETKVSKGEFERIYKKNNNNLYNESDKKTPDEYMDLFIDFKLKVIEAERLKMDTASSFIKELAGYREELAAPYLTNVKYNEDMVKELYNRTTKEINASHILLMVDKNATTEQEKEVLERILKIRQEILDGKDFEDAAFEYSEDPSAKTNRGNLGYFSAFQMVTPFENAAFSTPVGEISEPVKTNFGYHLLKVMNIRDNQGEILVAHIMKMFPKDMSPETKQKLKAQIDSIYAEVQNGTDFAELAKAKSDDKRSAVNGGEMPWFSAARMIPEFSAPAFALKNNGDISEVIESPYGYHIIKKIDSRPVPSYEASKEGIIEKMKRDPQRTLTSKMAFINDLKEQYQFTANAEGMEKLKDKNIQTDLKDEDFELFTIDGKSFKVSDFRNYLAEKNIDNGWYTAFYDNWEIDAITKLENTKLEQKYPDFGYLIQEYHDGILLFNISEEKIWNYAAEDTLGLQNFYDGLKNRHMWEERFKGLIITCKDKETRDKVDACFAEDMTPEEITDLINKDADLFSYNKGAWEKGSNPVVDYYVWNGNEPDNFDSTLTYVLGDKIPPEAKTLDEARGLYVSDYQKYLEENWIKELRKKYKITVNKKLLKTIDGV